MRREVVLGRDFSPIFSFINAVDGYSIDHTHGKKKTSEMLNHHMAEFEDHGIHYMKNRYGPGTPALTLEGLKAVLNYLTCPLAMRYKRYSIKTTTRYEAGDDSMKADLDANKASSNILNRMARDAVAQERDTRYESLRQHASAGASIAAPPEQVRERACLLLLHLH